MKPGRLAARTPGWVLSREYGEIPLGAQLWRGDNQERKRRGLLARPHQRLEPANPRFHDVSFSSGRHRAAAAARCLQSGPISVDFPIPSTTYIRRVPTLCSDLWLSGLASESALSCRIGLPVVWGLPAELLEQGYPAREGGGLTKPAGDRPAPVRSNHSTATKGCDPGLSPPNDLDTSPGCGYPLGKRRLWEEACVTSMRSCTPNGGGMEYGSRGYFDVVSASAISGEGTRGGDRMWGVPDVTSGPRWPVYVRCCARGRHADGSTGRGWKRCCVDSLGISRSWSRCLDERPSHVDESFT